MGTAGGQGQGGGYSVLRQRSACSAVCFVPLRPAPQSGPQASAAVAPGASGCSLAASSSVLSQNPGLSVRDGQGEEYLVSPHFSPHRAAKQSCKRVTDARQRLSQCRTRTSHLCPPDCRHPPVSQGCSLPYTVPSFTVIRWIAHSSQR